VERDGWAGAVARAPEVPPDDRAEPRVLPFPRPAARRGWRDIWELREAFQGPAAPVAERLPQREV